MAIYSGLTKDTCLPKRDKIKLVAKAMAYRNVNKFLIRFVLSKFNMKEMKTRFYQNGLNEQDYVLACNLLQKIREAERKIPDFFLHCVK